jgi:NDP-sugar pyrophosphorylase family protein
MVRVERSAQIGECTCIGAASHVLDAACISRSVIGRRCYIGSNARITNSFIMGGVTIGAGAHL